MSNSGKIHTPKWWIIWQNLSPRRKNQSIEFMQFSAIPSHQKYPVFLMACLSAKNLPAGLFEFTRTHFAGSKSWTTDRYHTANSELLEYLIQFLAWENLQGSAWETEHFAQEKLLQDGIHEPLEGRIKASYKAWQSQPFRDARFHLRGFRLASLENSQFMGLQARKYHPALQTASHQLDCFYLAEKLRLACEMLNRNNIIGQKYDTGNLTFLEACIKQNPEFLNEPAIRIYLCIYKLITREDAVHYFELRSYLQKSHTCFSKEEGRDLYDFALNFCIRQINLGHGAFVQEAFELYEELLQSGWAFRNKFITQWDFKNLVTLGIRLQKFEWVEQFLEESRTRLEPGLRENAYQYNFANIQYEKGETRRALRLLQSVEFTDVFYALSARALMVKILFEQKEWERLYQQLEAFRAWLKRSQAISAYQKTIHLNLIRFVKKAAEIQEGYISRDDSENMRINWLARLQQSEVANAGWVREILGG